MSNQEYIIKLYKKEKELLKICAYFNIYSYDAQDIIQDLYLILLEFKHINRYVENNEPNMKVIYKIVSNLIYHEKLKNKRFVSDNIKDLTSYGEVYLNTNSGSNLYSESKESSSYLIDDIYTVDYKCSYIENEINSMSDKNTDEWFKKNILKLYYYNSMTIQDICRNTNITYHFIQPIISEFKNRIKNKL